MGPILVVVLLQHVSVVESPLPFVLSVLQKSVNHRFIQIRCVETEKRVNPSGQWPGLGLDTTVLPIHVMPLCQGVV